jgi:zeta-carotene desaturase
MEQASACNGGFSARVDVIVIGGGLAGLAAAAALGSSGHRVRVLEARPYLGGRATSYEAGGETIDNCQHILLRCCINLLDFYKRLGVEKDIVFHRDFTFVEPGGRRSVLRRSLWSFLSLPFLSLGDKIAIARGLNAIGKEYSTRGDLDAISMLDWLEEKRQPKRAIERFWISSFPAGISRGAGRARIRRARRAARALLFERRMAKVSHCRDCPAHRGANGKH